MLNESQLAFMLMFRVGCFNAAPTSLAAQRRISIWRWRI